MKEDQLIDNGWKLVSTYRELPSLFFTELEPIPVREPQLVKLNEILAKDLGLDEIDLKSENVVEVFAGNKVPKGATPLAQAYAGHQFGYFTMLGDGRALLIGEYITPLDERVDIQLKGSGRTPYSRGGDGRAALGPMLREYIISEAMYALGIPTTRSLAVVSTGEPVVRQKIEKGAILTRIAKSHLRVGTFQYAAKWGTKEELQALADYALKRHYPTWEDVENKYLYLLEQVVKEQARTIAKWQLVGFIHGVMNTDNMTISGETIDYGPCAFMDTYDPSTVFSSIDRDGRYAYGNQPGIAAWNLARFAETLIPLLHEDQKQAIQLGEEVVNKFGKLYYDAWLEGMRAKLGLFNKEEGDHALIQALLELMEKHKLDYTNTFATLTTGEITDKSIYEEEAFKEWYKLWEERLSRQKETKEEVKHLMQSHNPYVIPRNHRVEEALEAAVQEGDYSTMEMLLSMLAEPYAYTDEQKAYTTLPEPSSCPYRTFCGT
nr:YdiU family protein [uncultured Niameybacter sp.]